MTSRSYLCAGCEKPRGECRCNVVPDDPPTPTSVRRAARRLLNESLISELRALPFEDPSPLVQEAMRKAVSMLTQSDAALSHAVPALCAGVLAKDHLPNAGKYQRRGAFERVCALVAMEILDAETLPAGIWNPHLEALAYDLAGIGSLAEQERRLIVGEQLALLNAAKGGTPS
jgi:hypothetical protein